MIERFISPLSIWQAKKENTTTFVPISVAHFASLKASILLKISRRSLLRSQIFEGQAFIIQHSFFILQPGI
jgi:hypothetical protein